MSVDMKVKAIYDSEISNITRSEKNWKVTDLAPVHPMQMRQTGWLL